MLGLKSALEILGMRNDKPNLIIEKSIEFSIKLIAYTEILEASRKYVLAKQLLRSGTAMVHAFLKRKTLRVNPTLFTK